MHAMRACSALHAACAYSAAPGRTTGQIIDGKDSSGRKRRMHTLLKTVTVDHEDAKYATQTKAWACTACRCTTRTPNATHAKTPRTPKCHARQTPRTPKNATHAKTPHCPLLQG